MNSVPVYRKVVEKMWRFGDRRLEVGLGDLTEHADWRMIGARRK
jgi:hypothetical protein